LVVTVEAWSKQALDERWPDSHHPRKKLALVLAPKPMSKDKGIGTGPKANVFRG